MNLVKISFMILFTLPILAKEIEMKGFKRNPNSQEVSVVGYVERVVETPQEFNILISKHNAFYILPKSGNEKKVIEFLEKSKTAKIEYKWVVDLYNRKIYEVKDVQVVDE